MEDAFESSRVSQQLHVLVGRLQLVCTSAISTSPSSGTLCLCSVGYLITSSLAGFFIEVLCDRLCASMHGHWVLDERYYTH